MALSVTEAVRAAKVSRAELSRAIQEGRISVTREDNDDEVRIDPAELFRLFEPRQSVTDDAQTRETRRNSLFETRSDVLKKVVESLETTIKVQDEAIQDLRDRLAMTERRLDDSESERRALTQTLTALLNHEPKPKIEESPKPNLPTRADKETLKISLLAVLMVAASASLASRRASEKTLVLHESLGC